jgi:dCMP deaminase
MVKDKDKEKKKRPPREVVSREDYYMGQALWASTRSKDPSTQVGAQIVSSSNKPLGKGYNGPPSEIYDTEIDWDRPEKYPLIIHAEINAINHSNLEKLKGSTIYVTGRPCKACMLQLVDKGISKVVFLDYRIPDASSMLASEQDWAIASHIAKLGRITLVRYSGNLNWMADQMERWKDMGVFD